MNAHRIQAMTDCHDTAMQKIEDEERRNGSEDDSHLGVLVTIRHFG